MAANTDQIPTDIDPADAAEHLAGVPLNDQEKLIIKGVVTRAKDRAAQNAPKPLPAVIPKRRRWSSQAWHG